MIIAKKRRILNACIVSQNFLKIYFVCKMARRIWAKPIFKSRDSFAFKNYKISKIISKEKKLCKKLIRISFSSYRYLVRKLSPKLQRINLVRQAISVEERILVTLK